MEEEKKKFRRRSTKRARGLENMTYEGRLNKLGLFRRKKRGLSGEKDRERVPDFKYNKGLSED